MFNRIQTVNGCAVAVTVADYDASEDVYLCDVTLLDSENRDDVDVMTKLDFNNSIFEVHDAHASEAKRSTVLDASDIALALHASVLTVQDYAQTVLG